ncbi:MAG TPA: DUF4031 domain-containing protein [Sporichthyaceae bacterium]|jgi:hypothetical protein|nr:DUF4031 domain-containing protein [Sporichthyaceae bacterium]
MAILIDPPLFPGHGRMWSHVSSDSDLAELHAFAQSVGIPAKAFDRDHYDVPADWYERLLEAGARPVSSRALVAALRAAGLRTPKSSSHLRVAS